MKHRRGISIGVLAKRSHSQPSAIRYYESIGLMPRAVRGTSGQRIYDEQATRRMALIRRCRDFGFPIGEIRKLVRLIDDDAGTCAGLRDVALGHLAQVRIQLAELKRLERALAALAERSVKACGVGPARSCRALAELAAPLQT